MSHFTDEEFLRSVTAQDRKIDNSLPEYLRKDLYITMAGADRIRALLGYPMVILSGYRCKKLNDIVGGSPSSQHMIAQAFDFVCPKFGTPEEIVHELTVNGMMEILGIDQLILEPGWVHVSFTLTPRHIFMDLS